MILKPFDCLLPRQDAAASFSCSPYDVIVRQEARLQILRNNQTFLKVTRSDADLPDDVDAHSEAVYERAASNLRELIDSNVLRRDSRPCLYVLRQEQKGRSQTGVVGCVSVADYSNGTIRIHEKTRPDKVQDRARHMLSTGVHAEPVFLAFHAESAIESTVRTETAAEPLFHFTDPEGVTNILWRISEAATPSLINAFAALDRAYIADGHHRAESAKICSEQTNNEAAAWFPAVLFPHDQLAILPYNRVIRTLPDSIETIMKKAGNAFHISETDNGIPTARGTFCMYISNRWHLLRPRIPSKGTSPVDSLDVSLLSSLLLEPVFGVADERTDPNIDFVGGIHGTKGLEELVSKGKASCAFSLHPVSIEDLFRVADAGLLMPPKSTWFEPKVRSGLFVHAFR